MFALNEGDAIRGDASAATVVDYTLHGIIGTTLRQLANGQLASSEGNLYTAVTDGIAVIAICLVNTDSSSRTLNIYLKPKGGTSRRVIPQDITLAAGYSLYANGTEIRIIDTTGHQLTQESTVGLDDSPVNGETNEGITSNWAFDHNAAETGVHAAGGDDLVNTGDTASTTAKGIVELAINTEINTGTSATLAVTPDALAGSIFGEKIVYIKVLDNVTALTTGDGKAYITIPDNLNGMNLVDADIAVYTTSSSGNPTVQLHNLDYSGGAQDMLSTRMTIDAGGAELSSYTAATPPVINSSYDDVATGDRIRIDVDVAGTGTKGLDVILTFQLP